MNTAKKVLLIAGSMISLLPVIVENAVAATPQAGYACGRFGPAVTNNVKGDLAAIATAMFASPGDPFPADFLEQGPWFLMDSYGTGALQGCRPTTSNLNEPAARQNTYNELGMLVQQKTERSKGSGMVPATLNFKYLATNPYLLSYAEQFCFGAVDTLLNRISFEYMGNRLTKITIAADSGCPNGGATYSYSYGSPVAPNLPSKVTIVNDQHQTATQLFNYVAQSGLLTATSFPGGKIVYGYNAGLLTDMTITAGSSQQPLSIGYTTTQQWASAIDPRYHWGLTISYQNNVIGSTLQDTGCPGFCQPSTFTYAAKPLAANAGACHVGSRKQHLEAGRAFAKDGQAFAKGSEKLLGPVDLQRVDRLRERGTGQFYPDPSCR